MIGTALTDGLSGLAWAYTAVQAPMIAGLVRSHAQLRHYLVSPVIAATLTAVAAAGAALSSSLLAHWGLAPHGLVQLFVGTGISAALGYAGGEAMVQGAAEHKSHNRGSLVVDRPPAAGSRSRQNAREAGVTLAGLAVPAHDETKHFKLIGTTGTGKSTAIQEMMISALA